MTAHDGTQTGPIAVGVLLERLRDEKRSVYRPMINYWNPTLLGRMSRGVHHDARGTDTQRLRAREAAREAWPWWWTLGLMVGVVGAFLAILGADTALTHYDETRPTGVIRPMPDEPRTLNLSDRVAEGNGVPPFEAPRLRIARSLNAGLVASVEIDNRGAQTAPVELDRSQVLAAVEWLTELAGGVGTAPTVVRDQRDELLREAFDMLSGPAPADGRDTAMKIARYLLGGVR